LFCKGILKPTARTLALMKKGLRRELDRDLVLLLTRTLALMRRDYDSSPPFTSPTAGANVDALTKKVVQPVLTQIIEHNLQ